MARIDYSKLGERVCAYCKGSYKPTGPAQVACTVCQSHLENVHGQVKRDIIRYRKFGTYEYLGKGSSNKTHMDSPFYTHGVGYFHAILSPRAKREFRYCQSCGKDLIAAGRYHWCAHHLDHDRTNNVWENITLYCKQCHQIEHECWKAFQS